MNKLTPTIDGLIKELAKRLPVVDVHTKEFQYLLGAEILEWGTVTEIDGEPINPAKEYRWHYPVIIRANHYRRLKRGFIKHGVPGMQKHLEWIKRLISEKKIKGDMKAIMKIMEVATMNLN